MSFDPERVPLEHADMFYHGKPGPDGRPVGLTDEQWDAQAASMRADGTYPLAQGGVTDV